jgi:hypothetical protein
MSPLPFPPDALIDRSDGLRCIGCGKKGANAWAWMDEREFKRLQRLDPDRWDLPPPRLGELREAGVFVSMSCPACHATWRLDPAKIDGSDTMPVKALAYLLTCACGRRGGLSAVPEHVPWVQWLRKTRQTRRLPWSAAFVPDEESG